MNAYSVKLYYGVKLIKESKILISDNVKNIKKHYLLLHPDYVKKLTNKFYHLRFKKLR
jgi:hypothetical protein